MPKGKEPSVVMYATSSKSVLYNSPEKSPSNPARILNSVVFPEPFSPNIPATPLNGSENDAPFSTTFLPNFLEISSPPNACSLTLKPPSQAS